MDITKITELDWILHEISKINELRQPADETALKQFLNDYATTCDEPENAFGRDLGDGMTIAHVLCKELFLSPYIFKHLITLKLDYGATDKHSNTPLYYLYKNMKSKFDLHELTKVVDFSHYDRQKLFDLFVKCNDPKLCIIFHDEKHAFCQNNKESEILMQILVSNITTVSTCDVLTIIKMLRSETFPFIRDLLINKIFKSPHPNDSETMYSLFDYICYMNMQLVIQHLINRYTSFSTEYFIEGLFIVCNSPHTKFETVQILIKHIASKCYFKINMKNFQNMTILELFLKNNITDTCVDKDKINCAKWLFDQGASPPDTPVMHKEIQTHFLFETYKNARKNTVAERVKRCKEEKERIEFERVEQLRREKEAIELAEREANDEKCRVFEGLEAMMKQLISAIKVKNEKSRVNEVYKYMAEFNEIDAKCGEKPCVNDADIVERRSDIEKLKQLLEKEIDVGGVIEITEIINVE